jgi:dihydroflavonol-4-reductase
MRPLTIALTGASGFIGRVLTPLLQAEGHTLRVLSRSGASASGAATSGAATSGAATSGAATSGAATSGAATSGAAASGAAAADPRTVRGDLLDKESLDALVAGADVVIHLAAVISIADEDDKQTVAVNVTGTSSLLEAARRAGVRRFIHLSSVTAYEQAPYDDQMDESRGPAAATHHNYEYSKTVSQALALDYNDKGLEVIVLAPTAVIGPFDYKPSLMGKAAIAMYKGRVPALFPGGVDFVDVRDVAGAIVSAITSGVPGSAYLLSGRWVSLQAFSMEVGRIAGDGRIAGPRKKVPVLPLWLIFGALPLVKLWARLTGGPPYYTRLAVYNLLYSNKHIDCTRAREALRFHPRPFEETLKDTIAWFRQNGMLFL